ncbi:antA/AntB antirepressor family protein [Arsenophonus sp. PmNCSU2021_1]|uniref:antA/AntB antirepressor family protein n=1 Tax=Arsenophonus sp. PmNCSU2021_1 TaxID=3118989 RepID=UPI002FF118AC
MQNLINIKTKNINGELIQTVNARDLHAFLEIGKDFTTWIKDRIKQYGFAENQDYIIVENLSSPKSGSANSRQQVLKEYAISLNMAKELSMVERNEKGKQARQYFECERRILQPSLPGNYIEALEALVISEKEKAVITDQRDQALRTKSQISRTREASAMGKLSVATRKNRELTERLGESFKHATITAVKNATGKEYKFAPLRRWCRENQVEATEVPDIRYGQVKSWPAESWLQVYGINLKSLFANSQRIH